MALSSYHTLLSLDRYASIMGINPVHFNGVGGIQLASGPILFPLDNAQNDVWPRFEWQSNDRVSHEELGREIWLAEQEIAEVLGYFTAPMWTLGELYAAEHFHRPDVYGLSYDQRWGVTGLTLRRGHFIASGRRKVTLLDVDAVVTYSDLDTDGFSETAIVFANVPAGTTIDEVKLYHPGHGGEPEWEIRWPKSITLVGTLFTATYNTWMMIKPGVSEALPSDNEAGIDLTIAANLITVAECYRETTDTTQDGIELIAVDANGIPTSTGGYISILDPASNFIMPVEAVYNSTTGAWEPSCCVSDFQYAKLWYKSGLLDPQYRLRIPNDQLSDNMATTIAYLATARLPRAYATNNNSTSLADSMRQDLAMMSRSAGNRYIWPDLMNNPFGTHRGEYEAWKRIRRFPEKRIGVATL